MIELHRLQGERFKRETVELDGTRFEDCTFEDCTLLLRGFGPFEISEDCTVGFGCKIETPAAPGLATAIWLSLWQSAARTLQ